MRLALDSNILVYLSGVGHADADQAKVKIARRVIADLATRATIVVPIQALGSCSS